jgi:hypothetical protein
LYPRILPKNERTNLFLVLLGKKTEFVCLFFGRIRGYQNSFRNYLTFRRGLRVSFKVGKNQTDVYNLPFLSKHIFMDTPLECFMTASHLVLLYSQTFTNTFFFYQWINIHLWKIITAFLDFSESKYSVANQKNVNWYLQYKNE